MLAQNRLHAPRERQLVPDRLACRHADNIGRHAEARDHAHRSAGQRAYHNRFCTDVDCHAAGGVGDGVEQVADLEFCVAEAGFVVDVLLGFSGNCVHGVDGFHRILARGGLAGEHDGAGAVVDGVGDVRNLRARGAGIVNHGFEHLCRGDDACAAQAAGSDQLLLDGGQLRERNLDAEVAARDHDALADVADRLDVIHTRPVFDFCDDVDGAAAVGAEKRLEVQNILLAGDERGGDEVYTVFNAQKQILFVLFAQIGLFEDLIGKTHALVVRQVAADDRLTADFRALHTQHAEAHQPVVDENRIARAQLLCKVFIAHGDNRGASLHVAGSKGEKISVVDMDLAVFECAGPVLGSLGVEHDGNGQIQLLTDLFDHVDLCQLLFVRAVGKIEAGNVDARLAHGGKNSRVTAGRTDGSDNFCFSHKSVPSSSVQMR